MSCHIQCTCIYNCVVYTYDTWHSAGMFFILVQWSKTLDFKLLEGEYVLRDLRSLEYTICNLQKVNMIPLVLFCYVYERSARNIGAVLVPVENSFLGQ